MKINTGKNLSLIYATLFFTQAIAQTNIGGTVNTYVDVTAVGICPNKISVSNSAGFTAGNSVILIQMQGATMDESNSSSFGNISSYNSAGLWEKLVIHSVAGNTITFTRNLLNTYNISGKVQMILMPTYANANVNSTLTGAAWNGTTGGVIAIEVTGTLTLNSDIDATGIGFRGGANTQVCPATCFSGFAWSAYYYGVPDSRGAYKGEGIASTISGKQLGKGKQVNGGGGGNDHNNGGGGGGNYSNGGVGGNNDVTPAASCHGHSQFGIAGLGLNYSDKLHLFLGGGGGAGHGNNGNTGGCPGDGGSGEGGDGGGLVIIFANSILGNDFSIISAGTDGGGATGDGAGGGGAGGVIFLIVPTFTSNLVINVTGGDGGNTNNTVSNKCFGPGGGGGAGLILSNVSLPGNVATLLTGGMAGFVTNSVNACNNTHTTATDGSLGVVITGATLPQSISGPNAGCGLPVTFIHFTGRAIQEKIELKWATATEVDADYFAIERSSNQVDFVEIGRVAAAGNTSTRTDYDFIDALPYPGTNYYRIRQADVTGYEKLTTVIAVNPEIRRLVKNAYPNPVQSGNELYITFTDPEKDHTIRLTDISGRLIRQWDRPRQANTLEKLSMHSKLAGVYLLIVQTSERTEVLKLVVN